jgi:hypothetical protein
LKKIGDGGKRVEPPSFAEAPDALDDGIVVVVVVRER